MLVLARKSQEEIYISDNIRLTVLEIKGGRVKLGISASPEVKVLRSRVHLERSNFTIDFSPKSL